LVASRFQGKRGTAIEEVGRKGATSGVTGKFVSDDVWSVGAA